MLMTSSPLTSTATANNPAGQSGIALSARGLHVTLGASHILRGIDIDIHDGEVVALQGANGSGKSTLVRTLTGIIPASSGEVALYGQPVDPKAPWGRIGYVPQRVGVNSGINSTALEVVSTGLLFGKKLRLPRNHKALSKLALEQVGLAHRANSPMSVLSGGQQQRVLIARALVREPDLLVLDEPVSGVDQKSQKAFARTLQDLAARGLTIVIVLHGLGEFRPLITRCVTLEDGVICHDAPVTATQHPDHGGHDHVHPHTGFVPEHSPLISETGFEG